MPSNDVINLEKKKVGTVELSSGVFGVSVSASLIHEAVKAALANKRTGSACTKGRGDVKASGKKPYRQKGTGRARHGSSVSPIFVGGGVVFGPKPRDYTLKITKKKKKTALKSALSMKVKENKLLVIDKWVEKQKTKDMAAIFKAMDIKSALIIVDKPTGWLERATYNIPYIDVIEAAKLNTLAVVAHDFLVCTKEVISKIEEGLK